MTACVVLVWAVMCGFSVSRAEPELDSDLIETETGWQFADDPDVVVSFDAPAGAPAGAAPTAAAKVKTISGRIPLVDGDFEQANITCPGWPVASDNTCFPNWMPGGSGVTGVLGTDIKFSATDPSSKFAVHLNNLNVFATTNTTQGWVQTQLATNPGSGKTFTVQFDCARNPNGPINYLTAVKVSALNPTTNVTSMSTMHHALYNSTDTVKQVSWSRMSFVFKGTGAVMALRFESMSGMWGPIIDNVVMMSGSHPLSAAPAAYSPSVWQRMCPLVTVVVVLASFRSCPLSQLLSLL